MKTIATFNKIYIIESLREMHSGKRLEDAIFWKGLAIGGPTCQLFQPRGSAEFLFVLEDIRRDAEAGIYPIIHIEAHGSKDGLEVASGAFIAWDALRERLTAVNVACRNNLLVTMAACEGAHLFQVVKPTERAPFCGLIGPKKEIAAGELESDYSAFYSELLQSFDGNRAIEKLNNNSQEKNRYLFFGCNYLFVLAYGRYHTTLCAGSALRQRIEKVVSDARARGLMENMPLKEVRRLVKQHLVDMQEPYFEKYKAHFMMIDLYPYLRERWDPTLDAVREMYESIERQRRF
ncbi:MAG: hypothetical protein HZB55_07165 [Deltaproteobacteria bacterium]|nr:hypothetical protein [Deltaproteobacteria bacterium]